jgi:O-succinylbenzoate synthase
MGYCDCHPWEELGDSSLEKQLLSLKKGEKTPLLERSLYFAKKDAEARHNQQSLLSHLNLPLSHFLITNIGQWSQHDLQNLRKRGYTHIKIKMGRNLESEIRNLYYLFYQTPFTLRLDFNESLSLEVFEYFLDSISALMPAIEFIEDPIPYHRADWAYLQQKYSVALACDRHVRQGVGDPLSCQYLIAKPAIQDVQSLMDPKQITLITSYLDHPLGQVYAAYMAAELQKKEGVQKVHGLHSHYAYEFNPFSQELAWASHRFKVPAGMGCGFDVLLQNQQWVPL